MSTAALKQANAVSVTNHAIERRLTLERATEGQIDRILESHRDLAEEIVREEIFAGIELVPEARRIFMHPGREAVIGLAKPRTYFDRNGRKKESAGFRVNDSRYFWSGDVVYVIDHQTVVTCILPDERQVVTLFSIMPQAEAVGGRTVSILAEAERSCLGGCDGPQSKVVRLPVKVQRREAPPMADWQADRITLWTVIVAGEDAIDSGLEERAVREISSEIGGRNLVFIENTADKSIERIASLYNGLKSAEARAMPELPDIEWSKVNGKIPPSMKGWWHEMAQAAGPAGRLVTVMTPKSARSLLETANGSSDAGWRLDEGCCKPGSKLNLIMNEDGVLVARDKY